MHIVAITSGPHLACRLETLCGRNPAIFNLRVDLSWSPVQSESYKLEGAQAAARTRSARDYMRAAQAKAVVLHCNTVPSPIYYPGDPQLLHEVSWTKPKRSCPSGDIHTSTEVAVGFVELGGIQLATGQHRRASKIHELEFQLKLNRRTGSTGVNRVQRCSTNTKSIPKFLSTMRTTANDQHKPEVCTTWAQSSLKRCQKLQDLEAPGSSNKSPQGATLGSLVQACSKGISSLADAARCVVEGTSSDQASRQYQRVTDSAFGRGDTTAQSNGEGCSTGSLLRGAGESHQYMHQQKQKQHQQSQYSGCEQVAAGAAAAGLGGQRSDGVGSVPGGGEHQQQRAHVFLASVGMAAGGVAGTSPLESARRWVEERVGAVHWRPMLAGVLAGVGPVVLLQPLDVVRTRLQVQERFGAASDMLRYAGPVEAFRKIWAYEGAAALYQGVVPAVVGSGVAWGVYMLAYNNAKARYGRQRQQREGAKAEEVGLPAYLNLLAATEAGVISCCATNPIWLVRTRLQLQTRRHLQANFQAVGGPSTQYRGFLDALRTIAREEGLRGFYRGLAPSLLLISHGSINFMVYEELKLAVKRWRVSNGQRDTPVAQDFVLAGLGAKVVASLITYPLQVIRARIMQRGCAATYPALLPAARAIIQREGVAGLYKGITPTLLRVAPQQALFFLIYEYSLIALDRLSV